jgi:uncharacterized membrane protein
MWTGAGFLVMIVASVLFWGSREVTLISPMIMVPPVGIFIVGAAVALAGNTMPAKTQKGAQDAARWRAFLRYLHNLEKLKSVEDAASRFDQFVPYAVAFGMEKELVKHMVPALQSMPTWYYPTYMGGPWHRGYRDRGPVTGMGSGDFSLGGPGGLNDMSHSLSDGLNAMSSGLTHMLNSASSAMTSRPSSSGHGGGFSGGGSHGGGGSGGGHAGFG